MHLRVLTLNVWHAEGDALAGKPAGDPQSALRRLDIINRELHRLRPDLIALQGVIRTDAQNQLTLLLDDLDLYSTHQADTAPNGPPASDRHGGLAIATRWPHHILETRNPDPEDSGACLLAARVSLPFESELLFIAGAWPAAPKTALAQERQALALADLEMRHRRALPSIIAGHFNAAPETAAMRFLSGLQSIDGRHARYRDAWAAVGNGPGHTWHGKNLRGQGARIDYIFVTSSQVHTAEHCTIRAATLAFDQPVDGILPGDHFGVLADIEIGKDE